MVLKFSDEELEQAIMRWNEEQEKKRWKNDKYHNDFLEFVINKQDNMLHSDSFVYDDEPIRLSYTGEEFEQLIFSLYDIVSEYVQKHEIINNIPLTMDDYFVEEKCYLKIKEEHYYLLELVVGQGSFVRLKKIDGCDSINFVSYEDMIKWL